MTKVYDAATDLITFARSSSATYLDSDGVIKTAATDAPRIEYAADGSLKGLLIEEQKTNLVTYSEDFTDAAWQKIRGTAVLDAVGPDGLSNSAATFTVDTVGGVNNIYVGEDFTVSTSTSYTFSIFAKADQTSDIQIRIIGFTTPAEGGVFFDLSAGTVGNDTGAGGPSLTGKIEDFGNGWHRCSVTFTTDATDTTGTIRVFLADGESLSITRDGTSSVLIYGAQLEQGSFATSYIPTSGSQSTRSPDIASIPVSAFGYNQSAGTVLVEASPMSDGTSTAVNLGLSTDTGGTANRWQIRSQSANTVRVLTAIPGNDPFSTLGSVLDVTGITIPGTYKAAHTFEENYSQVAVNGSLSTADTTVSVPDTDEIRIGTRSSSGTETLNGHIKSIQYYPRRLTDAQLQELTA